jgi:cell division protein FtsI (penicillin-binding protein 3)
LQYGGVLQKLQKKARFVWIKRNLTPQEQYKVLSIGEPGLAFKQENKRVYPQSELLAHVLGYTSIDEKGLAGIEQSFDSYLTSSTQPLQLSIDVRLQYILSAEIMKAMSKYDGNAAAGIIMDVNSGEILAAVSAPSYDPHYPGEADKRSLFNRFSYGVYELGSVFKIFSTAALLETTDADLSKTFDASKPLERYGHKISDYHAEDRVLSVPEVFMVSSNIGSALMGEYIGTKALKRFYSDLGLLNRAELEIAEVGAPIIPDPWREITTLTASYGHGIAVTALQMVVAASSIVNGGFLIKPTLVLNAADKKTPQNSHDIRIVSPQTAHRIRQLMRLVVTDGTGSHADVPGYEVGGKTGTADKSAAGGYDEKRRISSFIAFFPMRAPEYAVFIMIDEPKGNKDSFGYATGGWVAAPAAGAVIQKMGPLLGVASLGPGQGEDISHTLKQYIHVQEKNELATY